MNEGMSGAEAMGYLVRSLSTALNLASPTAVVFALQNVVVEEGTSFSAYMDKIRSLVHHAQSVGHSSAKDCVLQLAVRESVCDQYSTLTAAVFQGKDHAEVPFDSIEELMKELEKLSWNVTGATTVRRTVVRVAQAANSGFSGMSGSGRSKQYALRSQASSNRVMSVQEELDDEELEFVRMYSIQDSGGTFGSRHDDPGFYVRYPSREEKDKVRLAFGHRCLNCGDNDHYVRDCPKPYL
ncbi:unnamed protein product, partial [Scytosiphon promiscuus]